MIKDSAAYKVAQRLRQKIGRAGSRVSTAAPTSTYDQRIAAEQKTYADETDVHALPPIASYWADRYVRPMVEEFGFNLAEELFAKYLAVAVKIADGPSVFLSLGAGNCDTEVRTVQLLRDAGVTDFVIECLELNPRMLERGRALAAETGVLNHLSFIEADFNRWKPERQYKAVIANQVLHHVLELEHVFAEVKRGLHPQGFFVTGDMIGRNGHQRWPEALVEVQRFWRELPLEYRWNRLLNRFEEEYIDHDCSSEGFEGIRAQDVLPLLIENFDFHVFVPFGNVIDPFVDRCFGHNFDEKGTWDRAFIDRVHLFDEQAILDGILTPTHMYAVLTPTPCRDHYYSRGLTPERCVRRNSPARSATGAGLRIETPLLRPTEPGGSSYSMKLCAAGGVRPYTWVATELPPGLELSAEGVLRGSIECDGAFTPLITVKDASRPAQAAAQRYTILEKPRNTELPLAILQAGELPPGTVGVKYTAALLACGGRPPLRWSLAAGEIPAGLVLDRETGVISGEPLATSRSAFTVRVADAAAQSVTARLTLETESPLLEFSRVGVVPHLSCGDDWDTSITVINPSQRLTSVSIEIRSSTGRHLRGMLVPTPERSACPASGGYTLAPHSSLTLRIDPKPGGSAQDPPAWSEISASGPVTGFATYTYASPRKTRAEVNVPFQQPIAGEVTLPFDNEGENRTGLAVLNLSDARSDAVVAALWDDAGGLMAKETIPLAGGRHTAFMLSKEFPVTAGRRGMIVLRAISGGAVLTTCFCTGSSEVPRLLPGIPVGSGASREHTPTG